MSGVRSSRSVVPQYEIAIASGFLVVDGQTDVYVELQAFTQQVPVGTFVARGMFGKNLPYKVFNWAWKTESVLGVIMR